jgi:hypothetical protein
MFQNGICAQYIVRHDVKLPAELSSVKKSSEEVRQNALRVQRPSSTHYEDKAQT